MQTADPLSRLLAGHEFILMEAAVGEALSRRVDLDLHPELGAISSIYDQAGRRSLAKLYGQFIEIAEQARVPLLITAPTWRANPERLKVADFPLRANQEAVGLIRELQYELSDGLVSILLGGLLGPKNDAYRPEQGLSARQAEGFHAWQAGRLAQAGVDYLMAATIPSLEEAVGMARAMAQTRVPSIVSFVIDRQGRLLDGNSLEQAIDRIEASCSPRPSGYMINCSYPSFLHPEREDRRILDRILGYQANASSWQHHELDHCEQMQMDDVQDWGRGMLRLHREYGLQILGGCCGTGQEHLRYLVDNR